MRKLLGALAIWLAFAVPSSAQKSELATRSLPRSTATAPPFSPPA